VSEGGEREPDRSAGGPQRDGSAPAAVVVSYDSGEWLLRCVASLRVAGVAEVVVVDNCSSDGTLERLVAVDADVVVVPVGRNVGYGSAANLGVRRTAADYVVVCNPDLVVAPECVGRLADVLDDEPLCAIVGPRIDNSDGTLYPSARAFPSWAVAAGHAFLGPIAPGNRWSRRYKMLRADDSPGWHTGERRESDWVSGACLMVRRTAFASLGGFDEHYFMYAEDVDLCWRARRAGWQVLYEPSAAVVHLQGASTSRRPVAMALAHHLSAWRFARRSTAGPERALLPLVAAALSARLAATLVRALARSLASGASSRGCGPRSPRGSAKPGCSRS